MRNVFQESTKSIQFVADQAYSAGQFVVIRAAMGVIMSTVAAGELAVLQLKGVFIVPKATGTGQDIQFGQPLYFDATNKVLTATVTGNTLVGFAGEAAAQGENLVKVVLA